MTMMTALRWAVLSFFAICGFWFVPGRTWLQSDTQIYTPMFDRISDPSLYERDIMVQRQHVSLTIYDEVARFGHQATGLDYEYVLAAVQFITRLAGIYGLYLIGTALGLSELAALLVPAFLAIGTFIAGPAVVTFEYEPVPRGYAVLLIFLALGFAMHGRSTAAAIAAGIAFLFHAPAAIPFLIPFVYRELRDRNWRPLAYLAGAIALSALLAILQPGTIERQPFFSQADPEWEKLQRVRAGYNWLTQWRPRNFQEFGLHGLLALAAAWRLWPRLQSRQRLYALGLPVLGLLSMPVSYVLMEHYKWLLMAQVQPARAVLYTVAFSGILCVAAAVFAKSWWERAVWLTPVALVALNHYLLIDAFFDPIRLASAAAIVATAVLLLTRYPQVAAVAVFALTSWLFLDVTKQTNYGKVHEAEIDDVARWAKQNTPKDAMFQLPELTRSLVAGVFRVRSQRALYVDQKSGGQVNYSRDFSMEWWRRMEIADDKKKPLASWRDQGVDYIVLKTATKFEDSPPVYKNTKYAIYKLR
ncbi:hypothetical protein F183_A45130 [Bryobacterales bacterium F-183]|nr:hypothetical protein F183_A45130 [Bryobacterales bacterium F-183]